MIDTVSRKNWTGVTRAFLAWQGFRRYKSNNSTTNEEYLHNNNDNYIYRNHNV